MMMQVVLAIHNGVLLGCFEALRMLVLLLLLFTLNIIRCIDYLLLSVFMILGQLMWRAVSGFLL